MSPFAIFDIAPATMRRTASSESGSSAGLTGGTTAGADDGADGFAQLMDAPEQQKTSVSLDEAAGKTDQPGVPTGGETLAAPEPVKAERMTHWHVLSGAEDANGDATQAEPAKLASAPDQSSDDSGLASETEADETTPETDIVAPDQPGVDASPLAAKEPVPPTETKTTEALPETDAPEGTDVEAKERPAPKRKAEPSDVPNASASASAAAAMPGAQMANAAESTIIQPRTTADQAQSESEPRLQSEVVPVQTKTTHLSDAPLAQAQGVAVASAPVTTAKAVPVKAETEVAGATVATTTVAEGSVSSGTTPSASNAPAEDAPPAAPARNNQVTLADFGIDDTELPARDMNLSIKGRTLAPEASVAPTAGAETGKTASVPAAPTAITPADAIDVPVSDETVVPQPTEAKEAKGQSQQPTPVLADIPRGVTTQAPQGGIPSTTPARVEPSTPAVSKETQRTVVTESVSDVAQESVANRGEAVVAAAGPQKAKQGSTGPETGTVKVTAEAVSDAITAKKEERTARSRAKEADSPVPANASGAQTGTGATAAASATTVAATPDMTSGSNLSQAGDPASSLAAGALGTVDSSSSAARELRTAIAQNATPSAPPPPPTQQIAAAIASDGPRASQIDVTLSPEELGRVQLRLHHGDAGLSVTVTADRPETLDLMRRNIDSLAREFQDLGYSDVNFSFSDQPRDDRPAPFQSDESATRGQRDFTPTETNQTSYLPPEPRISGGGLDLRI